MTHSKLEPFFERLKGYLGVRSLVNVKDKLSESEEEYALRGFNNAWRNVPESYKQMLDNLYRNEGGVINHLHNSDDVLKTLIQIESQIGKEPRPPRRELSAVAEEFHPKTSYPMPNIERRQREVGMTDVEPDYEGTKAMPTSRASLARAPGV
jgi:hypothetical protein